MIGIAISNLRPGQGYNVDGDVISEEEYKKQVTWVIGKDENNTGIFGEISNPPTWAEIQTEIKKIVPGIRWEQGMKESDFTLMTREREHAITKIDNGVADTPEEQKRYDAKIKLRAAKPG